MKYYLLFILSMLSIGGALGQKITLSDLETICNKPNWTSVNQFLMNKNWEYYESEKGDSEHYSTIVWSLNKSYQDKAEGWFYLYTHDESPVKISYSVFNKPAYTVIQNAIKSKGYSLDNSEIENNEIVSTYSNNKFILKITTEKREKENSWDESVTGYRFLLIKKSSVYDPFNGYKVSYYDDGTKKSEYTLVNGLKQGAYKEYHENGFLQATGNFKDGLPHGEFQAFDEDGETTFEWTMSNGKKNGRQIKYVDKKTDQIVTYVNGIAEGEGVSYYYNEGELWLKEVGNFKNDEKDGLWKLIYINKNKEERLLSKVNYTEGLKNGLAQEVNADSLIIANYSNGKLEGSHKVYIDLTSNLFGGVIRTTDTTELTLISKGSYHNDKKTGYWKNYALTGGLQSEGRFTNGLKAGEWKNYYLKIIDEDEDKPMPYSEQLYLVENYENGKLNGTSTRYSYLNLESFPCENEQEEASQDSCSKYVYTKVLEKVTYKDDELHGPLEVKDSLGRLVAKGVFRDGLKEGKWLHRFDKNDVLGEEPFFIEGNYEGDEREGDWNWVAENGDLKKIISFDDGDLDRVVILDSLGKKPEMEFDILTVKNDYQKFEMIIHGQDEIEYQEYRMNSKEEPNFRTFHLLVMLGMLQEDSEYLFPDGKYELQDSSGKTKVEGYYNRENKIGRWIHYFYSQDVKLIEEYENNILLSERYLTLSGLSFSGDFLYVDEENNIKEVRSVKDALRHGKTEVFDLSSGDLLEKVRYKEGAIK